jgi:hypothetical protein
MESFKPTRLLSLPPCQSTVLETLNRSARKQAPI